MKYQIAFICIILSLTLSCSKKERYLDANMIERREVEESQGSCSQWEYYQPSNETPMRYIRMNFHIMQKSDGTGNFLEEEGNAYVKALIKQANRKLNGKNKKMNLPEGNETPVLPQRFQYVLTPDGNQPGDDGIYYHQDDSLYYMIKSGPNKNYYNRDVVKKYAINEDTVLNVFLCEHHTDSLDSPTYKDGDMGVALGSSVKILGAFRNKYKKIGSKSTMDAWFMQGLLNHEVGHVMGLGHSWVNFDQCDDTPPHPNCWNFGKGPCKVVSNNVMDYNTYREAWTPCQLGLVHRNLSRTNSNQRKLLVKDWCKRNPEKTVTIQKDEIWNGARDLYGDLIIESGNTLTIHCRVSLPEKGKLIVEPGGELVVGENGIIENDCDKEWTGILVKEARGKKGKVSCSKSSIIRNAKHKIDIKQSLPKTNN